MTNTDVKKTKFYQRNNPFVSTYTHKQKTISRQCFKCSLELDPMLL